MSFRISNFAGGTSRFRVFSRACGIALIASMTACSSSGPHEASASDGSHGGAGGSGGTSPSGSPTSVSVIPTGPALPTPDGGTVAMAGTTTLALSNAPDFNDKVKVVPNRSSVILHLPGVQGAKDYRVFAVEDGVKVSVDSSEREHIDGATITCAGLRQRNQCDPGEVLPIKYNNDLLDMGVCDDGNYGRHPPVPAELMQTIEIDGVKPETTLVVEAIDRQCPFPGLFGTEHKDIKIVGTEMPGTTEDATIDGKSYKLTRWPATFPVQTEAEIRAMYGSMILNGEGPNNPTVDPSSPNYPESPYIRLAQPAPPDDPVVLARSIISVSPTGDATLPAGFTDSDYFDDFDDPTDQPVLLRTGDPILTKLETVPVKVYTTKKWVLYDVVNEFSEFFVDRGQMNMVMGDPAQDSMSVQGMYPKRPVHLPELSEAGKYLHVTYEVQRDESARRYENFSLCGADTVGQTYDGDTPKVAPLPRPGFMDDTKTARSSALGWNCLYLVGRGAGYGILEGGDVPNTHSDTTVKITEIATNPPSPDAHDYDSVRIDSYATGLGPTQEPGFSRVWERQIDAHGKISGMWLDDKMFVWQRAKFDVFVRRDRVVVYVDGQLRICQDIKKPLTMAEGALGFWHILYHTSAEFTELRAHDASSNPATGQHQVLHNTPFGDQRSYDNVGFRENVPLPSDFDDARCYSGG